MGLRKQKPSPSSGPAQGTASSLILFNSHPDPSSGNDLSTGSIRVRVSFLPTDLPEIKEMILGIDPIHQRIGIRILRTMSAQANPPLSDIVSTGIVPTLVSLLDTVTTQTEGFNQDLLWVLTNIAGGEDTYTMILVDLNIVSKCIHVFSNLSMKCKAHTAWLLGNVAGTSTTLRDQVIAAGALEKIVHCCQATCELEDVRTFTWCMTILLRGKPEVPLSCVQLAIPVIVKHLETKDNEVMINICLAMSYMTDDRTGTNQKLQAIMDIKPSLLPKIINQLFDTTTDSSIQESLLRVVGNFISGNDTQTQAMLDLDLLNRLPPFLEHKDDFIRKESCWMISNLTAGTHSQIQAVLDTPCIDTIISMIQTEKLIPIQIECIWVLKNIFGGSADQIKYILNKKYMSIMAECLSQTDEKLLSLVLESMNKAVDAGQQFDPANPRDQTTWVRVKELSVHTDPNVAQQATQTLVAFKSFTS